MPMHAPKTQSMYGSRRTARDTLHATCITHTTLTTNAQHTLHHTDNRIPAAGLIWPGRPGLARLPASFSSPHPHSTSTHNILPFLAWLLLPDSDFTSYLTLHSEGRHWILYLIVQLFFSLSHVSWFSYGDHMNECHINNQSSYKVKIYKFYTDFTVFSFCF